MIINWVLIALIFVVPFACCHPEESAKRWDTKSTFSFFAMPEKASPETEMIIDEMRQFTQVN